MKNKKQYCYWSNPCSYKTKKYLCCNFCDKEDCKNRCKDKCLGCKYLTNEDKGEEKLDIFKEHRDFNNIEIKKKRKEN